MSSIHNDLAGWAQKARLRGHKTIEIDVETADRASEQIVQLATALEAALIGGNHLAYQLIGRLGAGFSENFPKDMDPETALRRLHATVDYDIWCAWAAMMKARDIAYPEREDGY
ncbi:hypothetical protein [Rhizobium phage RHEph18]|uniref:hypothetical protein n=1 Tax=Rhizobium TaxID=379 RepID=UPI0007E934E4|nr:MULTISPECIES: hypothetical protein [Rhizobium]ANL02657.1 hypothetical protein AMJ99_CH01070 [Rhizobium esperanzae]ANM33509.1 hypothetical protein AMK04_CH01071 [Rhizobium sp. N871]QIG73741.1 hypothetical protein EVC05_049 [Rhizobium phage RHph_N2]QXV74459.1 hypothetical protein [Rhizobium phage RHEph18]